MLVVEAKLGQFDWADLAEQLKQYMLEIGCPTGLLVSPDQLRIYRDHFKLPEGSSVELAGEYDVSGTLGRRWREASASTDPTARGFAFEREVQAWLESLPNQLDSFSSPLREAIDEHIVPVLLRGEVRAAGPRWHASPASAP